MAKDAERGQLVTTRWVEVEPVVTRIVERVLPKRKREVVLPPMSAPEQVRRRATRI